MAQQTFGGFFPQGSTVKYTALLQDETGIAIPAAGLVTLTLTVYAIVPPSNATVLVNAIDHANILNTGRGTVDINGNLAITLTPADMPLLNNAGVPEDHIMLIEFTFGSGGSKEGVHEVRLTVNPVMRF